MSGLDRKGALQSGQLLPRCLVPWDLLSSLPVQALYVAGAENN